MMKTRTIYTTTRDAIANGLDAIANGLIIAKLLD
jgi:hypothetical protein